MYVMAPLGDHPRPFKTHVFYNCGTFWVRGPLVTSKLAMCQILIFENGLGSRYDHFWVPC